MSTENTPRTNVRATKKYKALITAGGLSDTEALKVLDREDLIKDEPTTDDPRVTELVKGGFTKDEALAVLAKGEPKAGKKVKKAKKAKKAEKVDPKKVTEVMVAKQGLDFTRGRTYSNPASIEAQVRVMKTGKPEIIATSGAGRVAAVLIVKEPSGDVSVQNLHKPA